MRVDVFCGLCNKTIETVEMPADFDHQAIIIKHKCQSPINAPLPSPKERTYTAKEIEEMLTLPCCHISGTHNPTHYQNREYICKDQIADAFENLCRKLLINPKVRHSDNCGWCRDYPDKTNGDGLEFWNMPDRCYKCGMPKYYHEYRQSKCDGFVPTTFDRILELYGEG